MKDMFAVIKTRYAGYDVHLGGDFNIDLFSLSPGNYVADFLSTMYSNSMRPLILRPTRIGNTSATLIDHIWSNCSNENVSSGIISCGVSDHFIVYAATGARRAVVPLTVSKRLISDASNENFSTELN